MSHMYIYIIRASNHNNNNNYTYRYTYIINKASDSGNNDQMSNIIITSCDGLSSSNNITL